MCQADLLDAPDSIPAFGPISRALSEIAEIVDRLSPILGHPVGDPTPLDDQHRGSVSVTYQPTHFSQLRLQYNNNWTRRMNAEGLPGAFKQSHEVILQLQGNIGTHGAHPY